MDREETIARARKDFGFLRDRVLGVMLYGSVGRGEGHERSDIDICIVAPDAEDPASLWREAMSQIRNESYDVRIFEALPLYMKMAVIDGGTVVCSRDILDLYEYFYPFRREWKDQEHRQQISRQEMLAILHAKRER
jgi:predicted nucleotidyltransferase